MFMAAPPHLYTLRLDIYSARQVSFARLQKKLPTARRSTCFALVAPLSSTISRAR